MEINEINKQRFSLAGVVPVDGQPLDFGFPWHDSLAPIGQNYLAVEKAVFDCAVAGCDTIWVVCPKEMQPLIRYRMGDYVVDPIIYHNKLTFAKFPEKKEIPIYYVPTHPKDAGRRESLSWSIITGAHNAYRLSRKISRWVTPDKYFVAFPYGMFSPYYLRQKRSAIKSANPFYVSFEGKNFKDGYYLPFTFDAEDFINCRRHFRASEKRAYADFKEPLPPEERYTGRFFKHDFVFEQVKTEDGVGVEVPWYEDISTWEKLKKWLSSENKLDKPAEFLLSYNEWNPIGEELETEE
jgi:hypothetical protein